MKKLEPTEKTPSTETLYTVRILLTGTTYKGVILGEGAVLRLTKAEADALVGMGAATITGI
jgi:hypothetical protein